MKLILYRDQLLMKIHELEKCMESLPKEKLLCVSNGQYTKWKISKGPNSKVIPKANREYAEKLAQQKYYQYLHEELLYEINVIDNAIKQYEKKKNKSQALLSDTSNYRELLEPYFQSFTNPVMQWMKEPYIHNPNYQEHLIHKTLAGHMVRSKSEVIIANTLYLQKIPYKYECGLQLGDLTIYPDFTIMHPKTQKEYYLEHFGMLDYSDYREKAYRKIALYGENGIYPMNNLLITTETKDNPFDSEQIQKIINWLMNK